MNTLPVSFHKRRMSPIMLTGLSAVQTHNYEHGTLSGSLWQYELHFKSVIFGYFMGSDGHPIPLLE